MKEKSKRGWMCMKKGSHWKYEWHTKKLQRQYRARPTQKYLADSERDRAKGPKNETSMLTQATQHQHPCVRIKKGWFPRLVQAWGWWWIHGGRIWWCAKCSDGTAVDGTRNDGESQKKFRQRKWKTSEQCRLLKIMTKRNTGDGRQSRRFCSNYRREDDGLLVQRGRYHTRRPDACPTSAGDNKKV